MAEPKREKDDALAEAERVMKRLLETPPTPHKEKPAAAKDKPPARRKR